jgi:signal transduction histidine kinase
MRGWTPTWPAAGGRPAGVAAPWRALAYLLVVTPVPALVILALAVAARAGAWELVLATAAPVVLVYLALAVASAPLQRRAVAILGLPAVARPRPGGPGGWRRLRHAATGRELAHGLLAAALAPLDVVLLAAWTVLTPLLLATPLLAGADAVDVGPWTVDGAGEAWGAFAAGAVLAAAGAGAVALLAAGHAALAQVLLGPRGAELAEQVAELSRSRTRLVDAFDAERRRIEHDLHDGAQQHLVALAMTLDLARIELERRDAGAAAELVDRAHAQATGTLAELRRLVRGIHPPALGERGLGAALEDLARTAAVPVDVDADEARRPAPVESAAYFIVAEAVTNAIKHSGASRVAVEARQAGDALVVAVSDDGAGGADPGAGRGLAGLADRAAAAGGRLSVSSPPGGPTTVRAELPCPRGAA